MSIEQQQEREEYLFQAQTEAERSTRTAVTSITEAEAKNGRKYTLVTFANGYKKPVFNAKLLAGIAEGSVVDLREIKNDRGFWDLTALTKIDLPQPPAGNGEAQAEAHNPAQTEVKAEIQRPPADVREYRMMSMNSLTNATNIVIESMKLSSEFTEPRPIAELTKTAMSLVHRLHGEMMDLHNTPAHEQGKQA